MRLLKKIIILAVTSMSLHLLMTGNAYSATDIQMSDPTFIVKFIQNSEDNNNLEIKGTQNILAFNSEVNLNLTYKYNFESQLKECLPSVNYKYFHPYSNLTLSVYLDRDQKSASIQFDL